MAWLRRGQVCGLQQERHDQRTGVGQQGEPRQLAPSHLALTCILLPLLCIVIHLKGQCHDIQWVFALFCASKNGDCSRKCRGHHIMTARSAARTTSPPNLSRANVVFLQKMLFSAAFPCGHHYFSPHKMTAKNHRLSWHCRFKNYPPEYYAILRSWLVFSWWVFSDDRPSQYFVS